MKKWQQFLFLTFSLLFNIQRTCAEEFNHSVKNDGIEALSLMKDASYLQFTEPKTLIAAGSLVAGMLLFHQEDKKLSAHMARHKPDQWQKNFSNLAILFNSPLIPLLPYALSRYLEENYMVKFSQEYFAALELSLIETVLVSFIPIHPRPSPDNLDFWESHFRYESSFPSGHATGFSVLTFKMNQFYGPLAAAIPATFALLASAERIQDSKHYISDIVGSVVFSYMASVGVEKAAKNHLNSSENSTTTAQNNLLIAPSFYQGKPEILVQYEF